MRPTVRLPLRYALGVFCAYEMTALVPGCPRPTITTMVHAHRGSVSWRLAVWALLGVLAWHLLFEPLAA